MASIVRCLSPTMREKIGSSVLLIGLRNRLTARSSTVRARRNTPVAGPA
jgi:hypothetical protein